MTTMSAKRHLRELQWRFMLIALFFVVGAALAYNYRDLILPVFVAPLQGEKLVYLTPGGGFTFALLVSVYAGLAIAFPILLQQLYAFLSPALPEKVRRKSLIIMISSFFLLIAGILFGYFVAVPSALTFLYGFADAYVESSLTADSYTNFVVAYTIGIGIVFQIPLLLLLMHAIKPMKPGGLMKSQKWVILGAFIIAAIITPTPDPINQAIIAGPVVVVYQIGVIAVLITIARTARKLKVQERKTRVAEKSLRELALPQPAIEAEATALAFEETPNPVEAQPPALAAETEAELTLASDLEQALQPAPITESFEVIAEPGLIEETAIDPLLHKAIEAEAIADITPTPVFTEDAPIPEPLSIGEPLEAPKPLVHAQAQQNKVIDGFVRRPAGPIQVPQRPVAVRPPTRAIPPAPKAGPARGFYVDGIIAPRTA